VAGAGAAGAQPSVTVQRYENGSRLYATRRYVEAAHEFETAYALSQQPELLFNIGRAWEEARDLVRALDAYARFEAAGAPGYNVADLRARIARLRRLQAEAAAAPVAPVVAPAPPVVAVRPVERAPAPRFPAGPVATMAAGGAVALAAVPLWASARATYDELEGGCPGRVCASVQEADARRARGFAVAGDALVGMGVAGVAAGVTWLLLSRPSDEVGGTTRVTLDCRGGGCVAGVAGVF
jgi:hypothetical protein